MSIQKLTFLQKSVHNAFSDFIHNLQKLERAYMSIYWQMNKETAVFLSNGLLLSPKKE